MKFEDWKKLKDASDEIIDVMGNSEDGEDTVLYMTNPNNYEKFDDVSRPAHYNRNDIEAIEAIEASMSSVEFMGYLKGQILKYLWRYAYKDSPKKDLGKAQWYLNLLCKKIEGIDEKEISNMLKSLD